MSPQGEPARAKAASSTCEKHDFHVNVDEAVAEKLVAALEKSHAHALDDSQAPAKPGVYAIYEQGAKNPVYVGKAANSIRHRLGEHWRKIQATPHMPKRKYECRYLAVAEEWWVVLAETFLIRKYRPPWNGAGFASHVPGRGRPGLPERKSLWQQFIDGELSMAEAMERAAPEPAE